MPAKFISFSPGTGRGPAAPTLPWRRPVRSRLQDAGETKSNLRNAWECFSLCLRTPHLGSGAPGSFLQVVSRCVGVSTCPLSLRCPNRARGRPARQPNCAERSCGAPNNCSAEILRSQRGRSGLTKRPRNSPLPRAAARVRPNSILPASANGRAMPSRPWWPSFSNEIPTDARRGAGRCALRQAAFTGARRFKPDEVEARGRASTRSPAARAVIYPARRGASHRAQFQSGVHLDAANRRPTHARAVTAGETAPNSRSPEPAEGNDPRQSATRGVLIPMTVAKQRGEPEAGAHGRVSASARRAPVLLAPADPDAVEVGGDVHRRQAPAFIPLVPLAAMYRSLAPLGEHRSRRNRFGKSAASFPTTAAGTTRSEQPAIVESMTARRLRPLWGSNLA